MRQVIVIWRWNEEDTKLPEDFSELQGFLTRLPVPDRVVCVSWGLPNENNTRAVGFNGSEIPDTSRGDRSAKARK